MNNFKELNCKEDFMTSKWRPMMAVMYMLTCLFDFVLFPVGWTLIQFYETEAINDAFRQWDPLTLQGGGLFHVAMGAVLGVTAWSRGQEKMSGTSTYGHGTPTPPRKKEAVISDDDSHRG